MFDQFLILINGSFSNNKFLMMLKYFLHLINSKNDITFELTNYPCTPLNNFHYKLTLQYSSILHVSNNVFKNNDFQQKVLPNFKGMKNEFYIRSF